MKFSPLLLLALASPSLSSPLPPLSPLPPVASSSRSKLDLLKLRSRGGSVSPPSSPSSPPPPLPPSSSSSSPNPSSLPPSNLPSSPSSSSPPPPHSSTLSLSTLIASLYSTTPLSPSDLTVPTLLKTGMPSSAHTILTKLHPSNTLPVQKGKSMLRRIKDEFEDTLVRILLAVAVLSAGFSYIELRELAAKAALAALEASPLDSPFSSESSPSSPSALAVFVEPLVILTILIMNAIVGIYMSVSAEASLSSLSNLNPPTCTLLRDSATLSDFPTSSLVPGDVILLKPGDKVPADCRVLSQTSSRLGADESALTGEADTVDKSPTLVCSYDPVRGNPVIQEQKNTLFMGTCVTVGGCKALITATGAATEIGKISSAVQAAAADVAPTPLQKKLDVFAKKLTSIVTIICLLCFAASFPKMRDPVFEGKLWKGALYYAKVSVALGVAAIPEGLPAVITLCLSLGTGRMARRNVVVRRLPSVETLGCTTVICTDKTGTLTTNMMTVVAVAVVSDGGEVEEKRVEGVGYDPRGTVEGAERGGAEGSALYEVAMVAALCNDAEIIAAPAAAPAVQGDAVQGEPASFKFERVGEPTEAALMAMAEKLGAAPPATATASEIASYNKKKWNDKFTRNACLEFNRDRKSMSVLTTAVDTGEKKLLVKGAPGEVLARCSHVKMADGRVVPMTDEVRQQITETKKAMSKKPLRVLGLAVKTDGEGTTLPPSITEYDGVPDGANDHPLLGDSSKYAEIESGLTFVGLAGIKDPARPEVAGAINVCTKAGIRVMMITGDAKDTAVAIARDVNIFTEEAVEQGRAKAFEGREFFALPEQQQLDILRVDNVVFCRTEPADKQKLVKMLQSLGEVPAMTGDGVNDAPALQQAAIGIAMGITGTEVAKEAADMVLVDDNFATIVSAVEEGRCIYNSMQAFICFLISCNIGEIFCIFFASLLGLPEPLTAMHLLWVNLVTDGPPATALGFNPPDPNVMDTLPRRSDEEIMTGWLLMRYTLTGLYVGAATVGVTVWHYMAEQGVSFRDLRRWGSCEKCGDIFSPSQRQVPQTLALTTLVAMEMLKALSAVSVDNSLVVVPPWKNKWLLLGVTVPTLMHLAVVNSRTLGLPNLGAAFGMRSLTKAQWVKVLQFSAPILLVDEGLKMVGRRVNREEERRKVEERGKGRG